MNKSSVFILSAVVFAVGAASAWWLPARWVNSSVTSNQHSEASQATTRELPAVNVPTPNGTENSTNDVAVRVEALEQRVSELAAEVLQEQEGRLVLQRDIAAIEAELTAQLLAENVEAISVEKAHEQLLTAQQNETSRIGRFDRSSPSLDNLLAAGSDQATATSILNRLDEYALADLELRDRAAREGWLDSEDYASRRDAELPEPVDLRTELGEDGWDRYLYASGRNNRVVIASIISGSAASSADVQPGDMILSYAGGRIFTRQELQNATRGGQRGELVTARLSRADTLVDIDLPRGPLGVSLSGRRALPAGGVN